MKVFSNKNTWVSQFWQNKDIFLLSLTPSRLKNLAVIAADYARKRSRVRGKPFVAKLEISNLCNLRCTLCLHGVDAQNEAFRQKRMMPLEVFKEILNQTYRETLLFVMYHKGEPFLNKRLLEMCALASEKKVATMVSSNFSLPFSDQEIDYMVTSGLTYLILSIDGATQEVYEQYRVGGKLQTVLDNLRRLVEAKKRLKSKTPIICWQFIEFDHNAHELDAARQLAEQLGVDHFSLKKDAATITKEGYCIGGKVEHAAKDQAPFPYHCKWLWSTMVFLNNGEVSPCCVYDWTKEEIFGSCLEKPAGEIWNGGSYRANRKLVCLQSPPKPLPKLFCSNCSVKERHQ